LFDELFGELGYDLPDHLLDDLVREREESLDGLRV
jgi:hypothetical protein